MKDGSRVLVACTLREERDLPDVRRLRGAAARVHAEPVHHDARGPHAHLGSFRSPMDQSEQLTARHRDGQGAARERADQQPRYGCSTASIPDDARQDRGAGPPTPDDLDELIATSGKSRRSSSRTRARSPRSVASARGAACRRRPLTLFGSPFLTWRGLPLIPSDKLGVDGRQDRASCCSAPARSKRGVVGLFQPGIPGEASPSLSVRLMGINQRGGARI